MKRLTSYSDAVAAALAVKKQPKYRNKKTEVLDIKSRRNFKTIISTTKKDKIYD